MAIVSESKLEFDGNRFKETITEYNTEVINIVVGMPCMRIEKQTIVYQSPNPFEKAIVEYFKNSFYEKKECRYRRD